MSDDRVLHRERASGLEPELGWILPGRFGGNLERSVELELARLELLEQQIERHDFGKGGGMAFRVRIGRVQHRAGIGVDDDVGVRRGLGWMA